MAKNIVRGKTTTDFKAAFDKAAMEKIERNFTGNRDGITRRAALAALTCSKSEILGRLDDKTAEGVVAEVEALRVYISRLKDFVRLMDAAWARMLITLEEYAKAA